MHKANIQSISNKARFISCHIASKSQDYDAVTLKGFDARASSILFKLLSLEGYNSQLCYSPKLCGEGHIFNKCNDTFIDITYTLIDPLHEGDIFTGISLPNNLFYDGMLYFNSIPDLRDYQIRISHSISRRTVNYKVNTLSLYDNLYLIHDGL